MLNKNFKVYFTKRQIRYSIAALVTICLSSILTFWIIYGIGEEDTSIRIQAPEKTQELSPFAILTPKEQPHKSTDAESDVNQAYWLSERNMKKDVIVYPEWKSGNTHVEGAKPITTYKNYTKPIWSPVNLDIAFFDRELNSIFVINPNKTTGDDLRPLYTDQGIAKNVQWNSDGMSLNLTYPDGQNLTLFLTGETALAPNQIKKVWEQDGIILWQKSVEKDPYRVSGNSDSFYSPILSPDGNKVVYIGKETGLYITNLTTVDAGLAESICVGPGQNPSWLADSQGIVYDIAEKVGNSVIDGDLWYASTDGKERTNITATVNFAESNPVISSDGENIAFCSDGAIFVGRFIRSY